MASIKFIDVNKIYPNNVQAVFDFNLEIKDKEFIVFVGPSGCGKSTTLRMVAGLEDISSGEILIDDLVINDIAPKDRDVAMVFQSYALYPHMTVYENMAFALKLRRIPVPVLDEEGKQTLMVDQKKINRLEHQKRLLLKDNADSERITQIDAQIDDLKANPSLVACTFRRYRASEIQEKIDNTAEILGLKAYLGRKPGQLSGGQRQRVALGRAIVRNPKVFLMDEPLSNLDAKLRVQMRSEIAKIHQKVGATTIYVTHDQTEAMTMATRIVIMKDGYIQQIGTPKEVYNHPTNMFVAGFIGASPTNFINGVFDGKSFVCEGMTLKLPDKTVKSLKDYKDQNIVLGVRPEDIYVEGDSSVEGLTEGVVLKRDISELLGHDLIIYSFIGTQRIVVKTTAKFEDKIQDECKYFLDLSRIHFFDPNTTNVIKVEA
ncbi:MAG: ABC transporter ATP-binding protein [Bacilli bacterium]|jgi:multiple sugar transport system ATP-binding protein